MSAIEITESGLTFGPFPTQACFHIEQSSLFQSLCAHNIAGVEFILEKQQKNGIALWLVEAKSSVPRQSKKEDFQHWCAGINRKFIDALQLQLSILLRRHATPAGMPAKWLAYSLDDLNWRTVLVIPDMPSEHCPALQDALRQHCQPQLQALRTIWKLPSLDLLVLNRTSAGKYGLSQNNPA
ncbi:hypothetical protein V8J88_19875 [Massilia sp. W12]|uniref:hypothetical protein n=1 Tax=Massilia sp. W12 TaxID=3126507 RepID=UPI0030CC069E